MHGIITKMDIEAKSIPLQILLRFIFDIFMINISPSIFFIRSFSKLVYTNKPQSTT